MKNIIQRSKLLLISSISATITACNSTRQNVDQHQIPNQEITDPLETKNNNNRIDNNIGRMPYESDNKTDCQSINGAKENIVRQRQQPRPPRELLSRP